MSAEVLINRTRYFFPLELLDCLEDHKVGTYFLDRHLVVAAASVGVHMRTIDEDVIRPWRSKFGMLGLFIDCKTRGVVPLSERQSSQVVVVVPCCRSVLILSVFITCQLVRYSRPTDTPQCLLVFLVGAITVTKVCLQ